MMIFDSFKSIDVTQEIGARRFQNHKSNSSK